MYFVVFCTDKPGFDEVRAQMRPSHRQYIRDPHPHPVRVHIAGPTHRADGAMNGTMLVVESPNESSVHAFLAADPYMRAGLFDDVIIRAWTWGIGAPERSS
jgi:uncharacterized protein YciI